MSVSSRCATEQRPPVCCALRLTDESGLANSAVRYAAEGNRLLSLPGFETMTFALRPLILGST